MICKFDSGFLRVLVGIVGRVARGSCHTRKDISTPYLVGSMTIRTLLSLTATRRRQPGFLLHEHLVRDADKSRLQPDVTPRSSSTSVSSEISPEAPFACAICTEQLHDPVVGGACTHHFCHSCLVRWASSSQQNGSTCPTCRAPIARIMRDPEFAAAIGVESLSSHASSDSPHFTIPGTQTLQVSWPPGILLRSAPEGTPGHLIAGVVANNGAARAGVKEGSILLCINDEPVRSADHQAAVALIERYTAFGTVRLTVAPRAFAAATAPSSFAAATHSMTASAAVSAYYDDDGAHTSARWAATSPSANSSLRPRSPRAISRREPGFMPASATYGSDEPSRPPSRSLSPSASADPLGPTVVRDGRVVVREGTGGTGRYGQGGDTELAIELGTHEGLTRGDRSQSARRT